MHRCKPTLASLMFSVAIAGLAIEAAAMIARQKRVNELEAIEALRAITIAQCLTREGDRDRDGVLAYATLAELSQQQLVDAVLGSGIKSGYLFEAAPSATTPEFLWFAVANPAIPGVTGDRSFETNQGAVIFYRTTAPFALNTTTCALDSDGAPVR